MIGAATRLGLARATCGHLLCMLMDIVIALVIVVIAAALGLTVHPLLWFIVIVAILWLFVRRGSWSSR
jgi:hypothetical protein